MWSSARSRVSDSVVELASLDGSDGFLLSGIDAGDQAGHAVSSAGDLNGDGYSDVAISAVFADGGPDNTPEDSGEIYIVFGKASGFDPSIDLSSLDGVTGFIIPEVTTFGHTGRNVGGAGDVNGDGIDDLVIGPVLGLEANEDGGGYVVYGKTEHFPAVVELTNLNSGDGFLVSNPFDVGTGAGHSVSGAGDVNGDGYADLIIGTNGGDGGPGDPIFDAGEAYMVFGNDFTAAVTEQGGPGDDILTGSVGDDRLIGAQGDDTLIGRGGPDVLYGAEGDDTLVIGDATFQRVTGGTGTDTLRLDGPGFALDLTITSDLKIEEIERIDLQDGAGAHDLTLDLLEVLNLSNTSNTLTVLGDAADTVDIGTGWTSQGISDGLETFTQGAAVLEIDEDIFIG